MVLKIEEIRESGLLELYVLGELAPSELSRVDAAIELFPELRSDLREIEKAFHTYAEANAIQAPGSVLNKILSKAGTPNKDQVDSTIQKNAKGLNKLLLFTLLATAATLLMTLFSKSTISKNHSKELQLSKDNCDEEKDVLLAKLELYKELDDVNNKVIPIGATDKYPETQVLFNLNEVTKRNFLQFKFLPQLEPNQSYQLWSLKGDSDPIPLNVFEDISELLEVDFIDGTNAYAITIEPKGGQDSPTLENLIGVFSLEG